MDLPVDAQRYGFRPAGTVRPVRDFDHKDVHLTDAAGVPLWDIDVMVPVQAFGEMKTEIYSVRVPAKNEPDVSNVAMLQLEHPTVSFYVSKGTLRVNFSAAGIANAPTGRRQSEQAA